MMLFSRRKREAEALLEKYNEATPGDLSERDRSIFIAGAMMGVSRGYDLGGPCEVTADGWCATHSTTDGPVRCTPDHERGSARAERMGP